MGLTFLLQVNLRYTHFNLHLTCTPGYAVAMEGSVGRIFAGFRHYYVIPAGVKYAVIINMSYR